MCRRLGQIHWVDMEQVCIFIQIKHFRSALVSHFYYLQGFLCILHTQFIIHKMIYLTTNIFFHKHRFAFVHHTNHLHNWLSFYSNFRFSCPRILSKNINVIFEKEHITMLNVIFNIDIKHSLSMLDSLYLSNILDEYHSSFSHQVSQNRCFYFYTNNSFSSPYVSQHEWILKQC